MQTDTFNNLLTTVKGLSGNTTFTTSEDALVANFINRRIYNAYRRSLYWPRYLVLGQERAASGGVVPFTQATLNSIDTFIRIFSAEPHLVRSVPELNFCMTAEGARVLESTDGASTFFVDYKKRWDGEYNTTNNTNVPQEFFQYAAHGAFADFLRYDAQNEKAAVEEQYAESLLVLELESAMLQRNANTVAKRMRTHNTQQNRFTR